MIVQAVDGKYYVNPVLIYPKWVLMVNEDGAFICKTGSATWRTAREHAKKGGVKFQFHSSHGEKEIILSGRLVVCSVFQVNLKNRIPVPSTHEGVLESEDSANLMEDHEVLSWTTQSTGTS